MLENRLIVNGNKDIGNWKRIQSCQKQESPCEEGNKNLYKTDNKTNKLHKKVCAR